MTFAADDRTFYATMAADGTTWLMRGDLRTRRLTALRRNVECPSLSPDGTRIAYKKRAGTRWRLHVLDLRRGSDTALAETADIDDQAAWLDGKTVGYAKPGRNGPEVFAVPADGSGAPRARYEGFADHHHRARGRGHFAATARRPALSAAARTAQDTAAANPPDPRDRTAG